MISLMSCWRDLEHLVPLTFEVPARKLADHQPRTSQHAFKNGSSTRRPLLHPLPSPLTVHRQMRKGREEGAGLFESLLAVLSAKR